MDDHVDNPLTKGHISGIYSAISHHYITTRPNIYVLHNTLRS